MLILKEEGYKSFLFFLRAIIDESVRDEVG